MEKLVSFRFPSPSHTLGVFPPFSFPLPAPPPYFSESLKTALPSPSLSLGECISMYREPMLHILKFFHTKPPAYSFPSLSLFISLPLSFSSSLSVYLSISLTLSISFSISLSLTLSIYLFIDIYLSVHLYISFTSISIYL